MAEHHRAAISPRTLQTSPIEQARIASPTMMLILADVARSDYSRERAIVAPRRIRIGPSDASRTTNGSMLAPVSQ